MRVRRLSQIVVRSRTLIRDNPKAQSFLKNTSNDPARLMEVVEEAKNTGKLSVPVLEKLMDGPLRAFQLKAYDMKTLSSLFHSFVKFKSTGVINWSAESNSRRKKVEDRFDGVIESMLDEILSLDRFLQFDNRLTISKVLLGMTMIDSLAFEKLKRMNYKVMSRSKRLHPETLVEVLVSWAKLKFQTLQEIQLISAEALIHRDYLSVPYLAQGIWAWSQLEAEVFADHMENFMEILIIKKEELILEDFILVFAAKSYPAQIQRQFQALLDNFFARFELEDLETNHLLTVLKMLDGLRSEQEEYWRGLLSRLGIYEHLRNLQTSEMLEVMKIILKRPEEVWKFLDRLIFELAQPETLPSLTIEDLIFLSHSMSKLDYTDYLLIFTEEFLCRDFNLNQGQELMTEVWSGLPIEEKYLVEALKKVELKDKAKLRQKLSEGLHKKTTAKH